MITIFETPYCTLTGKVTLCANVETIMSGFDTEGCDDSDQSAAVDAGLAAFGEKMREFWGQDEDAHDPFFQHWNGGKHVQFSDFKGRWYAARIAEDRRDEDGFGDPQTPAEVTTEQREAALAQTRTEALLDLCDAAATRAAEKVLRAAVDANIEWVLANPAEVE
jgi:hypothetical protein